VENWLESRTVGAEKLVRRAFVTVQERRCGAWTKDNGSRDADIFLTTYKAQSENVV
jgi:hypothetical protein